MDDMSFDDAYNVREAVDFLTEKLALREKLIHSARQLSEKDGGQKFSVTVKRFEELMTDFLRLYQPILDRIADKREELQKHIISQRQALTDVYGMIEVVKPIEVMAYRVQELETEAKRIEAAIKEKVKALEKIDDLLGRTKHHVTDAPRPTLQEALPGVSDQSDDLLRLNEGGKKTATPRKLGGRG